MTQNGTNDDIWDDIPSANEIITWKSFLLPPLLRIVHEYLSLEHIFKFRMMDLLSTEQRTVLDPFFGDKYNSEKMGLWFETDQIGRPEPFAQIKINEVRVPKNLDVAYICVHITTFLHSNPSYYHQWRGSSSDLWDFIVGSSNAKSIHIVSHHRMFRKKLRYWIMQWGTIKEQIHISLVDKLLPMKDKRDSESEENLESEDLESEDSDDSNKEEYESEDTEESEEEKKPCAKEEKEEEEEAVEKQHIKKRKLG